MVRDWGIANRLVAPMVDKGYACLLKGSSQIDAVDAPKIDDRVGRLVLKMSAIDGSNMVILSSARILVAIISLIITHPLHECTVQ